MNSDYTIFSLELRTILVIKKCWECHLMRTYPDKKFIVEISGEYEQFGITFYQEP